MARVFVITGPSGVGKGTLIRLLRERIPALALSVSATTRPRRPGEEDGQHYWFFSEETFDRHIADGDFVEWAEYSGNRYGTLRSELDRHADGGRPVVLEIELQGARKIRESMPEATQIFIRPPDSAALRDRLIGRGTDDPTQIDRRLVVAERELAAADEFCHQVVNDRLDSAVEELARIVDGTLAT